MKLQQLRYLWEVAQHGLNISAAAQRLHTSQPGISKQIRALEDELGIELFVRNGKQLSALTPAGQRIVELAGGVQRSIENIRLVAQEFQDEKTGSLSIATTHTQSRYVLPHVIRQFIDRYPEVALQLHQGSPYQIAELAARGTADFAIATEAMELFSDLIMIPCYRWNRVALVPQGHTLEQETALSLERLAEFPLVTYVFGFTGRSALDQAFAARDLRPKVVFTAADADVIKTYVRLGLGVGIVASMAYDPVKDADLMAIDVSHLFPFSTTKIGVQKGAVLRGYMYDFISMFSEHLRRPVLEAALACESQAQVDELFAGTAIPVYEHR